MDDSTVISEIRNFVNVRDRVAPLHPGGASITWWDLQRNYAHGKISESGVYAEQVGDRYVDLWRFSKGYPLWKCTLQIFHGDLGPRTIEVTPHSLASVVDVMRLFKTLRIVSFALDREVPTKQELADWADVANCAYPWEYWLRAFKQRRLSVIPVMPITLHDLVAE